MTLSCDAPLDARVLEAMRHLQVSAVTEITVRELSRLICKRRNEDSVAVLGAAERVRHSAAWRI